MLSLADALARQRACACDCHRVLSPEDRTRGVEALYVCDDVLRGWNYEPIYELHGDALWRDAQQKCDPTYRGVAVRFGECIYKRLLGSMLHEILHALHGDVTRANYGIPFGLPYGVPEDLPPSDEERFLAKFNEGEARAFVGVWILGKELFAIDWSLRTARDVGTYVFGSGNALVSVPRGFRPIAHLDRRHHEQRYYARARKLEEDARAELSRPETVTSLVSRVRAAEADGRARGPKRAPARDFGRMAPKRTISTDPCTCGSAKPFKDCCARGAGAALPILAR